MAYRVLGLSVLIWVAVGWVGCAFYDSVGALPDGQECIPGQVEPCQCANSGSGERTCIETGIWWGCSCFCDGIWCDGVCTAYQTDVYNCGRCGHACAAGEICRNGNCLVLVPEPPCREGQVLCEIGCVSLDGDPENCGACGFECSNQCMCIMGTCCDGSISGKSYRSDCDPAAGLDCKPNLVCYRAGDGPGACLFPCELDGVCPDGGVCVPMTDGGACHAVGQAELGEDCDPVRGGCRPGLDCVAGDGPLVGTCEARCDCETGAGCGVEDPDYTCAESDWVPDRCWCAGP